MDRKAASRNALLKNLATQVIIYEKINTTLAKAKAVKPIVEKIISRGKANTLANRRLVLSRLAIKKATKKVFDILGPKYAERKGGYCRIIKLPARAGDGANMAQIELV